MQKRRINVRAIIWRDGTLLAAKHKDEDGTPNEHWATPGGGLDPLETLEEGVRREVFEELGVEAEVGQLLAVHQFGSEREGFDEELEFFFLVKDSPEFDKVDLTKTSHGASELAEIAFVDPRTSYILPEFLTKLDIDGIESGTARVEVKNYL